MPHPAQSPYSELLNISEVATPSEISFDAPAYEPPSARLQRGLDDLACAQQTARAVKATPVMPRLYPRDAEPGALLATGKERVPSSSGPLLMRFGHSRGFLLKFSLSSEHEDSRRHGEPWTAQSQSPALSTVHHAFLRECGASLPARILPPGSRVTFLLSSFSSHFQLFVFQA